MEINYSRSMLPMNLHCGEPDINITQRPRLDTEALPSMKTVCSCALCNRHEYIRLSNELILNREHFAFSLLYPLRFFLTNSHTSQTESYDFGNRL